MKKSNKTNPIEAPAVVHPSSKEGQMDFFKDQARAVKDKYNTVKNGKGSNPRPVNKKKFDENFKEIDWSPKPTIKGKE